MTSLVARLSRRALTASTVWGYATDQSVTSHSGVVVDQETATRHSAVFGAQALLMDDISTLPLKAFRDRAGVRQELDRQPSWLRFPDPNDPNVTLVEHLSQVILSVLSDGNAFIHVAPNFANPTVLTVLPPTNVDVKAGRDGVPIYLYRDQRGGYLSDQFGPMDIVHISYMRKPGKLRGLSPIEALTEAIGSGMAAEQFSSYFYSNGANMQGVIEIPKEAGEMTQEQTDRIRNQFRARNTGLRNSHAVGILTGGAHVNWMTIKPSDALLIDAQKWSVEQVARAYKIPPHMLGSQEGRANAYASVEQKSQDYVTHAVAPLCTRIAKAYSRLLPNGSFVEFNLNGLLRADAASRGEFYTALLGAGAITPNAIADLEGLPSFDGGDHHYITANNLAPIDEPADTEAAEPPDTEPAGAAA